MKLKVYACLIFFLSIFLIFSGSSIQFLGEFNIDRKDTIALDKSIDKSYKVISKDLENLHHEMTEMTTFFSLYYEEIEEHSKEYQLKLQQIKTNTDSIQNKVNEMKEKCQNTVNNSSKQKCKSLKENKKMALESYNHLELAYNQFMVNYSTWMKNNQTI